MSLCLGSLAKCFAGAMEEDAKYIGILTKVKDQPLEELTVIRKGNFIPKLNNYLSTYDKELNHKFSSNVKIIAFTQADSLEEIENKLLS